MLKSRKKHLNPRLPSDMFHTLMYNLSDKKTMGLPKYTPEEVRRLERLAKAHTPIGIAQEIDKLEERVEECERTKKGEPGYTPKKGKDYFDGKKGDKGDKGDAYILTSKDKKEIAVSIKAPVVEKVIERREVIKEQPIIKEIALKDDPVQLRDKLETLKDDERLDKSAIKGLEELENKISLSSSNVAGQKAVYLYIDGVKKGLMNTFNLAAGEGVAIAHSKVNGLDTFTFTTASPTVTVVTPTGTVNASNTVFTVTAEPKFVVADGTTYFAGAGYTYNSLTITMDIAPSASIKAII